MHLVGFIVRIFYFMFEEVETIAEKKCRVVLCCVVFDSLYESLVESILQ